MAIWVNEVDGKFQRLVEVSEELADALEKVYGATVLRGEMLDDMLIDWLKMTDGRGIDPLDEK